MYILLPRLIIIMKYSGLFCLYWETNKLWQYHVTLCHGNTISHYAMAIPYHIVSFVMQLQIPLFVALLWNNNFTYPKNLLKDMSFYHIDIIISSNKSLNLLHCSLFLGPSPPLFNVSSFKGENASAAIQIYLQVMLFIID